MMAVPMVWLTDPNPEARYRCGRCKEEKPLKDGYRLLYRGTRRPIRCRDCEIATAPPGEKAYFARFEQHAARQKVSDAKRLEQGRLRGKRWRAAHQEEVKDYRAAHYQINKAQVNAATLQAYYDAVEQRRRQANACYAARERTPERIAARTAATRQRRAADRATWRDTVIRAAATNYDLDPVQVRHPPNAYAREARTLVIYLCLALPRRRDSHPIEELAAEFGLSGQGLRTSHTQTAKRLRRRRTDADAAFLYDSATEIAAACGYTRRPGVGHPFTRGRKKRCTTT